MVSVPVFACSSFPQALASSEAQHSAAVERLDEEWAENAAEAAALRVALQQQQDECAATAQRCVSAEGLAGIGDERDNRKGPRGVMGWRHLGDLWALAGFVWVQAQSDPHEPQAPQG